MPRLHLDDARKVSRLRSLARLDEMCGQLMKGRNQIAVYFSVLSLLTVICGYVQEIGTEEVGIATAGWICFRARADVRMNSCGAALFLA